MSSSTNVPTRSKATVFCEGNFAEIDGKTANGLVRQSERYEITSVIDSTKAGRDAGEVLDGVHSGIPVVADLTAALRTGQPDCFVVGVAPTSGLLSPPERAVILQAIEQGLDIVNGLHEFLNDDIEFAAAAAMHDVLISDVRRPRAKTDLHMFSGRIHEVTCPRIAVLGTDGAIGKRTTATILTAALCAAGVRAVLVGTGQTSLIQGARYGVALDAIPAQFVTGELEAAVVEAFEIERPDVIIVEGQGALSHPTYLSSTAILRGSLPAGVILQHAPARTTVSDFPNVPMPTVVSEINLIETFARTQVIGITINHEAMTDAEISVAIAGYEAVLGIPATDALARPTDALLDMVFRSFPALRRGTSHRGGVSAPRIEVDLDRIGENAQELVRRTAARGVSVTGITKAMRGLPDLGRVLLAAGAVALGDSRIENIERLRADGIDAPTVLIRSPLPSEIARVVAAADTSCNTELEVVELLSAAAVRTRRVHGVMLMVELGDLREGIMPDDVHDTVARCLALPNIEVRGIGANLACSNGVAPDDRNMGELSSLAESIEAQFGITLGAVSAGNSANLEWLRSTEHVGRIDDLRLGESILLGNDPLHDTPIPGLCQDTAAIFAEVIESKHKPRRAWGERAHTPFAAPVVPTPDDGPCGWQSLLGIGHQDTDPLDLSAPPGVQIIGASSDHLVITSPDRLPIGSEVAFRPGYSALVRAMSSRSLQPIVRGGRGPDVRR